MNFLFNGRDKGGGIMVIESWSTYHVTPFIF